MIKLYQVGDPDSYNPDYDEEQLFYFMVPENAQRECRGDRMMGDESKIVPGFFITQKELEQLKREAFESGQNSIVMIERVSFNDYLKQRKES